MGKLQIKSGRWHWKLHLNAYKQHQAVLRYFILRTKGVKTACDNTCGRSGDTLTFTPWTADPTIRLYTLHRCITRVTSNNRVVHLALHSIPSIIKSHNYEVMSSMNCVIWWMTFFGRLPADEPCRREDTNWHNYDNEKICEESNQHGSKRIAFEWLAQLDVSILLLFALFYLIMMRTWRVPGWRRWE